MTHRELMVEELLKKKAAARRVLVAIKKARKRDTLPSALQFADSPLVSTD